MKPSLLLVEDNAQTRAQLVDIIACAGYQVTTALDGLDALNQAQTQVFDMVVSDHKMPLMDGISLLRNLRDLGHYKEVPLVLLTTAELAVVERQAERAGADLTLAKPITEQRLHHVLDELRGHSATLTDEACA